MIKMAKLMTFEQAIQDSAQYKKRNLLLGNGFSIACQPDIFQYAALYEQADFSKAPEVEEVFKSLGTQDFELVIRVLEDSSKILPIYTGNKTDAKTILAHAKVLKDILLQTVAGNHPATPGLIDDEQFWACRNFLSNFLTKENDGRVYSLNYDLLLYWAVMHEDNPVGEKIELIHNDGFGEDEDIDDADYVVWKAESSSRYQRVHYLHGALHLFDGGAELKKYTWNRKGIPLIEQAREAIESNMYPLFVSEGTSQQKLKKIRHHAYLEHSFKSFHTIMEQKNQALFVYGHSLAKNDEHILKKIGRGKLPCVYLSIYGDPTSDTNKRIINTAESIKNMRKVSYPLEIKYYDAESAKVWG